MADTKNTKEAPALDAEAPVQEAPVVVREKRGWFRPLISALVVVAALVVGGIGGFAIATATQAARLPAFEQGQFPDGPMGDQQGQQGGPQQGGQSGQDGERPQPPSDQSGGDSSDDSSDSTDN